MSCYVNSNDNRFYAALESVFGTAAPIVAQDRFPADHLHPKQLTERVKRRDKTGTRTFQGLPNQLRRQTAFSVSTFLTAWSNQTAQPAYGPLFACALGSSGQIFSGGTIASVSSGLTFTFTSAHGLSVGQAISLGGELRFVIAIVSSTAIVINAPFTGIESARVKRSPRQSPTASRLTCRAPPSTTTGAPAPSCSAC